MRELMEICSVSVTKRERFRSWLMFWERVKNKGSGAVYSFVFSHSQRNWFQFLRSEKVGIVTEFPLKCNKYDLNI